MPHFSPIRLAILSLPVALPGVLLISLLVSLLAAGPALAQMPQPDQPPQLKLNPLIALRNFEPPANQPYELGRGDAISIDFAGRTELNAKRTIGPDGRITLPLAGAISLTDLTREQAAAAIVAALTPFYSRLTCTVGVDQYTSNRILLLGSVEHPGVVQFDQPPTLLEALTRGNLSPDRGSNNSAGGSGGGGGGTYGGGTSGSGARVIPHLPDRVAIYRGSDKVMWVDLKGLLDSGSPLADLRLLRDDIVYVPSPTERYVSVLGQVSHPGAILLDSNTTLVKLIAEAGGLTVQAGKNPDIQVIQQATGAKRTIPFRALLAPNPLDLTLKSGDVVYIPMSGFNQASYTLERLGPLFTVFTTAALINR